MVFGLDFDADEKRNMAWYIAGLLTYKFVLENMNACVSGIILNRLDPSQSPGIMWTALLGINLFGQCIGSLSIGPLVKRFPAPKVLAGAIICFAVVLAFIPLAEFLTGGEIPAQARGGSKVRAYWGSWSPYFLFAIFPISGLFHGMVELMRKVIPADIVGSDCLKLKQMDAGVHFCYEIVGTLGALSAVFWISWFGWGYAMTLIPIGFTLSFFCWLQVSTKNTSSKSQQYEELEGSSQSSCISPQELCPSFFHSIYFGGRLIFSHRSLIWLLPAYTLPLIMHRYLENTLFGFYTKSVLNNTDYQVILTGGSNFGELIGALLVLLLARTIPTPIPFLRIDALLLLLVWVFPYWESGSDHMVHAWSLAPVMALISTGWACGDVSLAAYIQSQLSDKEDNQHTTPLSAVMSFLYVTYLVCFFLLNLAMGYERDSYIKNGKDIQELFIYIGGVFFTVAAAVIFSSTFIPRGAWRCNPKHMDDSDLRTSDGEDYDMTELIRGRD